MLKTNVFKTNDGTYFKPKIAEVTRKTKQNKTTWQPFKAFISFPSFQNHQCSPLVLLV